MLDLALGNVLSQTAYMTIYGFEALQTTLYVWDTASERMTAEKYKQEMLNLLSFADGSINVNVVADSRNLEFVVAPDLQIWLALNLFGEGAKKGVKRFFMALREEDFIQNLAFEQILEEDKNKMFNMFKVRTPDEALEWIKEHPYQS